MTRGLLPNGPDRVKTAYNKTPDWAKVEEGKLRAGRACNAEPVAHITARK